MQYLSDNNIKLFLSIHPNGKKISQQDVVARCDICGDSKKNPNKKRLHLYQKSKMNIPCVKCFNCGYSSSFKKYITDYHKDKINEYIRYNVILSPKPIIEESIKPIKNKGIIREIDLGTGIKESKIVKTIIEKNIVHYTKSKKLINFLLKRKINPKKFNLDFYYSENDLTLPNYDLNTNENKTLYVKNSILIPLQRNNIYYGFYSRKIDEKLFYTYIPEYNFGYKIWNIDALLKGEGNIYIFESIFDALSSGFNITEIAGMLGSDFPNLKINKKIVLVFDNDNTGFEKALKYVDKYSVVNWPVDWKYKDCNEAVQDGIPPSAIKEIIEENTVKGFGGHIALKANQIDKGFFYDEV